MSGYENNYFTNRFASTKQSLYKQHQLSTDLNFLLFKMQLSTDQSHAWRTSRLKHVKGMSENHYLQRELVFLRFEVKVSKT